jgi:polyprenyl P-hydroxybenzoate/phenylacrylic acid decarboxylase-like protein
MRKKIILAITGASGSLYAVQFLKLMQHLDAEIHGIISDAGRLVLQHELGLTPDDLNEFIVQWHAKDDFGAPMSSGSSKFDAMLVLPCTMGTLGAIANGIAKNLVHRAADVMLKEKKPLLLAVRETPCVPRCLLFIIIRILLRKWLLFLPDEWRIYWDLRLTASNAGRVLVCQRQKSNVEENCHIA